MGNSTNHYGRDSINSVQPIPEDRRDMNISQLVKGKIKTIEENIKQIKKPPANILNEHRHKILNKMLANLTQQRMHKNKIIKGSLS